MSSKQSILKFRAIGYKPKPKSSALFCGLFFLFAAFGLPLAAAQKLAFLVPDKTSSSKLIAEKLETSLSNRFKILDDELAETAFRSANFENPFNLSTEEARNLGASIGGDFLIFVKSETLRRASLSKQNYYESYAVVYLVASQTGKLVFWKLKSFEAEKPDEAEQKLQDAIGNFALEISIKLKLPNEKTESENQPTKIQELPAEDSPDAKKFRAPLPYRRLKPEYTVLANLYGVTATVDATIDLDEKGKVTRAEITRWAGYGLDESVVEAIRKMQWRAAERDGKPLPIRVLLRYNFKKIKSDEN